MATPPGRKVEHKPPAHPRCRDSRVGPKLEFSSHEMVPPSGPAERVMAMTKRPSGVPPIEDLAVGVEDLDPAARALLEELQAEDLEADDEEAP